MTYLTQNDIDCLTPGMRIRSGGQGRGLARGRGRGPVGVPIGAKGLGLGRRSLGKVGQAANPLPSVSDAPPGSIFKFVVAAGLVAGLAMLINMHLFQSIIGGKK